MESEPSHHQSENSLYVPTSVEGLLAAAKFESILTGVPMQEILEKGAEIARRASFKAMMRYQIDRINRITNFHRLCE